MKEKINVLFISSEIAPFAKTGGLADVCGTLPYYLAKEGVNIRLMMPYYGFIDQEKYNIDPLPILKLSVHIGNTPIEFQLYQGLLTDDAIRIYFIRNDAYYHRESIYVNPENGRDWEDNVERFVLLSKAALEIIQHIEFVPDIIHVNDWQTGLLPLYLSEHYKQQAPYTHIKTLMSIHNIAYQGIFEIEKFEQLGLPAIYLKFGSGLEFWGRLNFLKAGIVYADLLNTVSKTYAQEIQKSEEFGYGLEGILAERKNDLYGILNGMDNSEWDPRIDEHIHVNYDVSSIERKKENKRYLLKTINMNDNDHYPLIGLISRLVDQKGIDLIQDRINELLELNIKMIILGTGEEKYHRFFQKVQQTYPDKVAVFLEFNNKLAHQIEAGSDMFLMPSKYEPCGLNQMYSLRYGTVPIVRETGGLADTVKDFDPITKKGNGFVFSQYDSKELLSTVKRAIRYFQKPDVWKIIMENGMSTDFSWNRSAIEYIKLYNKMLEVS
ncbi:glycogen synthase GlgA [candidate division KSB1 bacterium]|nr:glycogen synthase GlgA [candidate division KSB1 bacterium]